MPEDVALVALGGYGRGTLAPGSDLDLLILHDGTSADDGRGARRAPPVPACGTPACASVTRSGRREVCVEIAAERLDATTAMLDGRLLAGSASGMGRRAFGGAGARPRRSARVRANAWWPIATPGVSGSARCRPCSSPSSRRASVGSATSTRSDGSGPRSAARSRRRGILREAERRSVDGAEEFLTRVRSALHLETGRGSDRLLAEQQPSIAAAMGFADEPGLPAVDGLMRSVFEQARQVEHVTASVFDRFLRGTSPPAPLDATPEGILRAFASSARDGHVMPAASLDAMSAVSIDAERPWTGPTRVGVPRAPAVRTGGRRRARDPRSHRPARTLRARVGAGPMPPPARSLPPVLGRRAPARDARRRRPAAGGPGRRPVRGARGPGGPGRRRAAARRAPARHRQDRGGRTTSRSGRASPRETLDHMGASGPTADLALFLVAEHLLLSDTATRRDLDDERLIVDVADRVGDPGSSGGAVPPDDRRRRGDGSARVDAVARGPGPRARRQGPARPRTRRRGFGHRRAADRHGRRRSGRRSRTRTPRPSNASCCGCRAATS